MSQPPPTPAKTATEAPNPYPRGFHLRNLMDARWSTWIPDPDAVQTKPSESDPYPPRANKGLVLGSALDDASRASNEQERAYLAQFAQPTRTFTPAEAKALAASDAWKTFQTLLDQGRLILSPVL